ncbi:MAG: gliding motility-associated C-terminal domain-containing protein [Bacteroidales bacterium]|nr:gliding motility-associated C-terminal domain-containing protein [Bacteroidales bacterium]
MSVNTYANSSDLFDIDTCTVAISPSDTIIYSDNPIQLQLNATQGAAHYYWKPATGLSDTIISNPIATINNSMQYILEAYYVDEENLVYNGDFELGNTGFTTEYTLGAKPLQEGRYGVTDNGQNLHDGFMPCTHDGNFYVGNGSMYNSLVVFQSQVSVTPNTDYYFSSEVTAIDANPTHPVDQLALFQFNINNTQIGNTLRVNDSPCVWTSYGEVWNSGNNTTATITIKDLNTGQWANDFAIDNISLKKICKAYDTINIILVDTLAIPTTSYLDILVCENDFPYTYYDTAFNQVGIYSYRFENNNIIDSTHILTITSLPIYSDTIFEYIYRGDTYKLNGFDEKEDGLYVLVYPSSNGCDSNIYLSLNVIKLMFPNMVSPNGDGINDVFEIHDLFEGGLFLDNELIVYNRQGKIIYTIKNMKIISDFWDPAKTNSPTGTYFYRFIGRSKIKDLDFVGSIEVLR